MIKARDIYVEVSKNDLQYIDNNVIVLVREIGKQEKG